MPCCSWTGLHVISNAIKKSVALRSKPESIPTQTSAACLLEVYGSGSLSLTQLGLVGASLFLRFHRTFCRAGRPSPSRCRQMGQCTTPGFLGAAFILDSRD